MRQTLLYGESAGLGWENSTAFTNQNIDEIITATSGTDKNVSKMPRVSVPSPFARFDLIQKAYGNLARVDGRHGADVRDRRLVSYSLDVLELFYEGNENLKTVRWSRSNNLGELLSSQSEQQRLYGSALRMYLRQESYGFNEDIYYSESGVKTDDINLYFLTYNNDPVGMTSPVSLFMATPRPEMFQNTPLTIDGGKNIFTEIRPLSKRNEEFIIYVYRFMDYMRRNANPSTLEPLKEFRDYLESEKRLIRQQNNNLYSIINNVAEDSDPMGDYERADNISVLGFPMWRRVRESALSQIRRESDFVINSSRSDKKPLVLTNNFTEGNRAFVSKSTPWNYDIHKIDYSKRHNKEEHYPFLKDYPDGWLYEHDFLSDALVELPYVLDRRFFNGNLTGTNKVSYLLPLTPLFFEYFDYTYLMGKDGRDPLFKMEANVDRNGVVKEVTVYLKIAVGHNNNYITLKKVYQRSDNLEDGLRMRVLDADRAKGVIVDYPVAVNMYPFMRMPSDNTYLFQVLQYVFMSSSYNVVLHPAKSNGLDGKDTVYEAPSLLNVRRTESSSYYKLTGEFDYLQVEVRENDSNRYAVSHYGVLIPMGMPEYHTGAEKLRFSFDFGTSNSHIAVRDSQNNYLDFKLGNIVAGTIGEGTVVSEDNNLALAHFFSLNRQEFIPLRGMDSDYTFPMATILSVPKADEAQAQKMMALLHTNIPFVYGKEDYGEHANTIKSNIKWERGEKKYAEAYIEELVLLARGFAIEHSANLKECSFVWTYPVSMSDDDVDEFNKIWVRYYKEYFNPNASEYTEKVKRVTESIAPLLYYRDNDKAISEMSLSIDIGGGTCDVVVNRGDRDQKITSFRFGADNIFGVGKVNSIDMVKQGIREFVERFRNNRGVENGRKIVAPLENLLQRDGDASEANRFLFALETHPMLRNMHTDDKSYNVWLSDRSEYRLTFIYYYSAIIYYLTRLLINQGYKDRPESIFLSGTGSKLLNIIGGRKYLNKLTSKLIEGFSNGVYTYPDGEYISVNIETEEPKQLTAKGALYVKDIAAEIASKINEDTLPKYTLHYSMSPTVENRDGQLLNGDLKKPEVIDEILEEVRNFNKLFVWIMDRDADVLHIDQAELKSFTAHDSKLHNYMDTMLSNEYNDLMSGNEGSDRKHFKDVPFFFPIKWIIRKKLETSE